MNNVGYGYAIQMDNGDFYEKENYYTKPLFDFDLGLVAMFPTKEFAKAYIEKEEIRKCKIVKVELRVFEND